MEKIYRRDNGLRIKVIVNVSLYRGEMHYRVDVYTAQPKKRTYLNVQNTDDYSYRSLSMDDRRTSTFQKQLETITQYEYNECLKLAWDELKPKFL